MLPNMAMRSRAAVLTAVRVWRPSLPPNMHRLAQGCNFGQATRVTAARFSAPAGPTSTQLVARTGNLLPDAFLRVPAPLPYEPGLGIPQDVWDYMCPSAQSEAAAAGHQRAALVALPALQQLQAVLPATAAKRLGIRVIRKDACGNVAVGAFDVPPLQSGIVTMPRTWWFTPMQMLLLPQRLKCVFEFVDALANRTPDFGVLLSGPNGVGKSGIGLLAYLVCVVRRLPVVYIPSCSSWIEMAAAEEGSESGGDAFVLETFWRQNADLIAADPTLRTVFKAALLGHHAPFSGDVMRGLRAAAGAPDGPRVGVIADDAKFITNAVDDGAGPDAIPESVRQHLYFAPNWHGWSNANSVFPRMSISDMHGDRELKLSAGETHRLRIIEPLDPLDTAALQSHPASPAYIRYASARELVKFMAGNILRRLVLRARELPRGSRPTKAQLQKLQHPIWHFMTQESYRWLKALSPADKDTAARQVKALLRGDLDWSFAKPLYDAGLLYRTADSPHLHPTSPFAASIILHELAEHARWRPQDLRLITDDRVRAFELERLVLSCLNPTHTYFWYRFERVPTKCLDGSPARSIRLRCNFALPFHRLEEVLPRDVPVLYIPHSDTYPCDGILMPARGDRSGKIILLECSTEDPSSPGRIEKVLQWYRPDTVQGASTTDDGEERVAAVLQARYPRWPVLAALCYDRDLEPGSVTLSPAAVSLCNGVWHGGDGSSTGAAGAAATRAPPTITTGTSRRFKLGRRVRVLDRTSLRSLGLLL